MECIVAHTTSEGIVTEIADDLVRVGRTQHGSVRGPCERDIFDVGEFEDGLRTRFLIIGIENDIPFTCELGRKVDDHGVASASISLFNNGIGLTTNVVIVIAFAANEAVCPVAAIQGVVPIATNQGVAG